MSVPFSYLLAAVLVLCPASAALANGNVSHLWVSVWARDEVPAGDLQDLITRGDVEQMLHSGSNFPDGGYAVDDGYGEIAHWEPFQSAYLDWIVANYEPPWTDEAAQHIAFLMGMASHGMSDQVYDGTYLKRSAVYDSDAPGSSIGLDGSTDVAHTAEAGPLDPPDHWVPDDLMAQLMLDQAGHQVDASTIADGQSLVAFSIYFVSEVSQDPDQVAEHLAAYPWACTHQMDPAVPGNPPATAPVVAVYWERLWGRLHGADPLDDPLMATFPAAGSEGHPTGPEDIESMVSFVVSRGLQADTANATTITIVDEDGTEHEAEIQVYYGQSSHVVNLLPLEGWAADSVHTVTVGSGLKTWDGGEFAPFSFEFSTAQPDDPSDCTCTSGGGPPEIWLIAGLAASVLWLRRERRHYRSSCGSRLDPDDVLL